jgi:hypothetical protein
MRMIEEAGYVRTCQSREVTVFVNTLHGTAGDTVARESTTTYINFHDMVNLPQPYLFNRKTEDDSTYKLMLHQSIIVMKYIV